MAGEEKPSPQEMQTRAIEAGIRKAISERKPQDPLIGMKMGAQEVNNRLLAMLKSDKGVHIESFLAILGSLGGFACQLSIRGGAPDGKLTQPINVVKGENGRTYYMGDALNAPLAETQYSIWSLVAGAAKHAGCKELPDLHEIFKYVVSTLGGDKFGLPRYPAGHEVKWDTPEGWVRAVWPRCAHMMTVFCDSPSEWPVLFGLAAHNAIMMGKDVLDPGLAVKIVMEAAIPMSKVEPAEVLSAPKAA